MTLPHPYREVEPREEPRKPKELGIERGREVVAGALAILCLLRVVAALALATWDAEATAATLGLLVLVWTGTLRLARG